MRDTAIEKKGMKRLLVFGLILMVTAMVLSFCALQARAQSVAASIGYVGANHDRIRDSRGLNGLDAEISAAIDGTGDIFLNARYQNLGARIDSAYTRDLKYYEFSGNFLIPGFNHYAVAGVSSMRFAEEGNYNGFENRLRTTVVGPVVGVAGVQRLGDAVFNYSGGIHPLSVRKEKFFSNELPPDHDLPTVRMGGDFKYSLPASTGLELRGSVTHMIRPRFGYSGGYYWRRMAPGLVDHGFVVKTNFVVFK